ncbi:2Fe-2S iron-sulfur cluster-binding protein [Vibrio penaeicida]|uniref:2Fe-2S iron-sulfur cluster-binding protein n=1 Tax=Vibrio penaeicida TaxID=104609 RepID=UPI000F83ED80|nr:2Fe-2S iron-sulfur cluster binding domain-containing protein [Vibrio penaeicida]RTZ23452.1 2Fe-2S iron-sulfur cluster binding domain-containing protein [Vibrio penaeicida]
MYLIIINGIKYSLPKGVSVGQMANKIVDFPFGCLKGKCGRCLVKVIEGDTGHINKTEREFLKLMDLDDGEHRLLCKIDVNSNCKVESATG